MLTVRGPTLFSSDVGRHAFNVNAIRLGPSAVPQPTQKTLRNRPRRGSSLWPHFRIRFRTSFAVDSPVLRASPWIPPNYSQYWYPQTAIALYRSSGSSVIPCPVLQLALICSSVAERDANSIGARFGSLFDRYRGRSGMKLSTGLHKYGSIF